MPATESYLRNIKSMHQVFCLSAVVLLVCTVWMMWADYDDEWRGYQRKALTKAGQGIRQKRVHQVDATDGEPTPLAASGLLGTPPLGHSPACVGLRPKKRVRPPLAPPASNSYSTVSGPGRFRDQPPAD